jgi:hypothetical protein
MKKNIIILILATTALFSCKQNSKSTPEKIEQSQKPNDKAIYSKYNYTDSTGSSLTISNSLPKGGMKYTDANADLYNYAVFWTQINNETNNPLELKIDFPIDSYEVPTLPGKYFKVLIPSDTMTLDKVSLFNYGLTDLESFLDHNIHNSSSLQRTINPKQSSGFYVVILCLIEGAQGTLRTELTLKGQNLYYKINNKEINCGSINLKNLKLKR